LINDFADAARTVARDGGQNIDDVFGFDTNGTPGFSVGSNVLQSAGQTFATFSQSLGLLVIGFQSTETPATSALVNEVLQRITYSSNAPVPFSTVTLLFTMSDGNNGSQGAGSTPGTAEARPTVAINTFANFVDLGGGETFAENGPITAVDLDASITDLELDSADNFDGASLTVTRQGGAHSDDVIGLGSATVIVAGSEISVGGSVVAALTAGPGSEFSLTYNTNATSAIANQVLQAVNYQNTGAGPPASLSLLYSFHDGFAVATGTATVSISLVNDAPAISNLTGDELVYAVQGPNGNSPSQVIDQAAAVLASDPDGSISDE
jgi:hypothetical protein